MNEDILMLKDISDRLIAGTSLGFKRYLYSKIDWRNRFVCLKGAKGTGKTAILKTLADGSPGKQFFVAHPRRFGKSLAISTLQCLFEGRRELFKGLAIEPEWDWSKA